MAGWGGKRAGAGRKPGPTGMTPLRNIVQERIISLITEGRDVLDVAVQFAFDESLPPNFRLEAASVALPYIHPRLSAQTVEATTMHLHVGGAGLAMRTALLLERGPTGADLVGEADLVAGGEADLSPADVVMADVLAGVD